MLDETQAALAGLDSALRLYPGGEITVRYEPPRDTFHAQMRVCGDPAWPAKTTLIRDGWGPSSIAALVTLWRGDLGVWRYLDETSWRAEVYPPRRDPSGNPGPLYGGRLGRGDG